MRVSWQGIKVRNPPHKPGDASIQPRDGKIGPKGESCAVIWPETIIEEAMVWLGYPEMDQQKRVRVALARLSVHGTWYAFEETLETRRSGH